MKLKKYSKYKDSGIDWIGKIPEEWSVRRLKFINKLQGGYAFKSDNFSYEGNDIIRIGDIKNNVNFDNAKKYPESIKIHKDFKIKNNDVLIALTGATIGKVGKVNHFSGKAYINQRVAKISGIDNYYYYLLKSDFVKKQIELIGDGSAQENISNGQIEDFFIPFNQEQDKISSFLDSKTSQIEKLIEKDKKLIELLKEKRVSLINKAVIKGLDWKLNKFKHLFNFSKGLSITKENLEDEGIPCVNYGEIHSKYGFELDPEINLLKCVNEDYLKTSRKSLLKKGDFIFADTSEDLEGSGNFTYLNSDIKTFAGYHTVIARHIGNINHRFLAYFCDSELFRCQIRKVVKGVKVYSITNDILKNTLVWYPIREEQDQIVEFLDRETENIDNHVKKVEKRIDLYEEYKKSIIYNVVTGKVEV